MTYHEMVTEDYSKKAEKGNVNAQANLGVHYALGYGVSQNYSKAAKWLGLAAKKGDKYAQFNLGLLYERGDGVPQDYKEALKWYALAAEQGDEEAGAKLVFLHKKLNAPKSKSKGKSYCSGGRGKRCCT